MDLDRILNEIEVLEVEAISSKNVTSMMAEKAEDQTTNTTVAELFTGVYIDTKPTLAQDALPPADHILVDRPDTHILGEDVEDDDEIIVYVAPNPRKGIQFSSPTQSSSANVAAIPPPADSEPGFCQVQQGTYDPPSITSSPAEPSLEQVPSLPISPPALAFGDVSNHIPSGSSKPARRALRPRRVSKRRMKRSVRFSSFGAIQAEVALREVDPRRDDQRCGDSDIDWGLSTPEESVEDGGMLVDYDVDVGAMEAFVKGMSITGSAPVTMDDLEYLERSDGGSRPGESDEELELADDAVVSKEGGDLDLADSRVESEDESTSDGEEAEKGSFRARLQRLRKLSEEQRIKDVLTGVLDGEIEVDEEDSDIAQIQAKQSDFQVLSIPLTFSRQFIMARSNTRPTLRTAQRVRVFMCAGSFLMLMYMSIWLGRKRDKYIPEELHEQWERDRAKKAERRHMRELERSAAALDPFNTKKGGKKKKARKARLAASLTSPISLETVVGYMRRFVTEIEARTLPLPPMDQKMRKSVHELAHAFELKSKSKDNGAARFTTLMKTTLSGLNVDEKSIARILGKSSSYVTREGGKGKGRASKIRPRDGEVVGEVPLFYLEQSGADSLIILFAKAAPKLDGSNIGFKMLSAMGWEEGSRIGAVGGLEAPLVAVIKTTKLGLGANR
jgi:hypothetical protein